MPGAGTNLANTVSDTTSDDAARCLDLTRLVSRTGHGPLTGVDRVELAWARGLLARGGKLFALNRTATGFTLLDRAGMAALVARIEGRTLWGRRDLVGHLSRRLSRPRQAAESDLRRLACARCLRPGLRRMLKRHLPPGTLYLNSGHSNLDDRVMTALKSTGARIAVLIHDTIPLDFPQYQRPRSHEIFARKLVTAARHADIILANSDATAADIARHTLATGRTPPLLTARLAIDLPRPDPDMPIPERPYFVTVGTIEPRKNHALLLDIWDHFAATLPPGEIPDLFILGRRGWNNDAVFARLDRGNPRITEHGDMTDGQVAAMVQHARAMLFPSLAEGFGLPPLEAAALGTPVLCAPLSVYREFLGDIPVCLATGDMYSWANEIRKRTAETSDRRPDTVAANQALWTWDDHINLVLNRL